MGGEAPFRELVRYAVGGGWGDEEPTPDTLPVRVIRGTDFANIASGAFGEVPRRFEARAKAERRLLQANDIVLEISGGSRTSNQSTGRTLFITQAILDRFDQPVIPASFCRLIRVRDDVVVPRYAYFALQEMHRSGRAGLYEHHSTGISNFQFEYFLDQELVWLPPLPEQRAIAHILGTLDDKIELNRRMSETLEAIARALFRSWFVDFDPVRRNIARRERGQLSRGQPSPAASRHPLPEGEGSHPSKLSSTFGRGAGGEGRVELLDALFPDSFEDRELGEIPRGWEVKPLSDCVDVARGLSYKGSGLSERGVPMHNLNSIYEGGGYKHDGLKRYDGDHKPQHVARAGDLIVANTEQGHDRLLIGYAAVVPSRFALGRRAFSATTSTVSGPRPIPR